MKPFKPQLLPNSPAGESPDLENLPNPIQDYCISDKFDGGRVEIMYTGDVLGRSLKPVTSLHIQRMAKDLSLLLQHEGVIEAEFYSPNMTFAEIMHFFRCADVTSVKEITKLTKLWNKTGGDPANGWTFPGRDVAWLTTWHTCLKFYIFDHLISVSDTRTKSERYDDLLDHMDCHWHSDQDELCELIPQIYYSHIDAVYQAYDQALMNGCEGLVMIHKYAKYKCGRITYKSGEALKLKEDSLEYDGVILEVEESTVVREGVAKTVNELGRSKTSQLKDDRIPSGMAKGFKVLLEDEQTMSVSLNGYNHTERRELWDNPAPMLNQTIRFTAMAPVKVGGKPRGPAHFTKGNIRDDK
jgi:hypothetical protein